jgi:hypothetical protein
VPERPAGAFELLRHVHIAGAPGLVPDCSADLVEGVGGPLDNVERISALDRLRATLVEHVDDPGAAVPADPAQALAALPAEGVEEAVQRGLIAPQIRCPESWSTTTVIYFCPLR